MSIDKDILDRLMEGRAPGDLFGNDGILSELTKALAERALSTEMDVHLDEERAKEAPEGRNQPPSRRNGSSQKTVTTDSGKVLLDIPRDRSGTYDPMLIVKYQRRLPFGQTVHPHMSAPTVLVGPRRLQAIATPKLAAAMTPPRCTPTACCAFRVVGPC
ncbi:transposase [Antarcticimicrobium sediminis]|uniref:transposase n=1 Tax=Antarcticimicrobium sediminis TaxID=2546227 RepID=UPI001FDEDD23|nr:transposase [Antarcticimicrobium sediminis]